MNVSHLCALRADATGNSDAALLGLRIGGFTPLTTIDFPGQLAAVVFMQGCPWHCTYCHNTHLLPVNAPTAMSWEQISGFLKRRRGLLDGVVFSGGEPTLQARVVTAIREVKAMGFRAGLHTGGAYPERLKRLLPHLDWVGFDAKAYGNEFYERVTTVPGSWDRAVQSLQFLLDSGVDYEVRTTVYPGLGEDGLLSLARFLAGRGVHHYVVQECRPTTTMGRPLHAPLSPEAHKYLRALFTRFSVRNI